ncbi:MAG TPA: hypothetical protein PKZ36_03090 [Candidatus Paceibacterota bacterium]|nr:hypothetical protein [Candidatus Paceibacterota bacterium]HPT18364.1 hypothetical protein [Candidatus Paceibacterota bacterium]
MEEKDLYKGIEEIKSISMTEEEKDKIFEFVLSSKAEQKPIVSPWGSYFFVSIVKKNSFAFYAMAVLLVFILGGGGTVYASLNSLPGNSLYPLKVKIIEPLRTTLTFSLEKKAQYESNLAVKRLVEAEILASNNELDSVKEKQINNLLEKHTTALNEAINKVVKDESKEKIHEIATIFQNEMNIHAQILDIVKENNKKEEKKIEKTEEIQIKKEEKIQPEKKEIPIEKQDQKTEKIEQEAEKIQVETQIPEEIKTDTTTEEVTNTEEGDNEISKNARANAKKIKEALNKKEIRGNQNN